MSAPEEPMEQRPLAVKLRAWADVDDSTLRRRDLDAAADIVEAHQRLLDAIGDPDEMRAFIGDWDNGRDVLAEALDDIADAVDGAS